MSQHPTSHIIHLASNILRAAQIGVRPRMKRGTGIVIKRAFSPSYTPSLDSSSATLGAKLRYLRRQLGYPITTFATMTRLSHNTIAKLERNEMKPIKPWVLGRMLPFLIEGFKEAFPEINGDAYDYLIPPKTFGDWLRNFRLRHGLRQGELAKALAVNKFTITRYEKDQSKPCQKIQSRLKNYYELKDEFDRFFGDH